MGKPNDIQEGRVRPGDERGKTNTRKPRKQKDVQTDPGETLGKKRMARNCGKKRTEASKEKIKWENTNAESKTNRVLVNMGRGASSMKNRKQIMNQCRAH